MATTGRVHGSTCPQCRESGKSMVELRYFEAIRKAFGEASSGLALRSESFTRRSVWVPDITVPQSDGLTLLVEYDGSYWHADQAKIDREKSRDLLAAGAVVVRLREEPLPSLEIDSPDYLELSVDATASQMAAVIASIHTWLSSNELTDPT